MFTIRAAPFRIKICAAAPITVHSTTSPMEPTLVDWASRLGRIAAEGSFNSKTDGVLAKASDCNIGLDLSHVRKAAP